MLLGITHGMEAKTVREQELIGRARGGDREAAEKLFVDYIQQSKPINGLLRRALFNPADREEMLHDIFLQLMCGPDFRGEAQLSTYVYQIARRTVFQKFRREKTRKRGGFCQITSPYLEQEAGLHSNPEYRYSMGRRQKLLRELIEGIPRPYRIALQLRVLNDMTYAEIANQLHVPLNTVSTKIHKGKKNLFEQLKRHSGSDHVSNYKGF